MIILSSTIKLAVAGQLLDHSALPLVVALVLLHLQLAHPLCQQNHRYRLVMPVVSSPNTDILVVSVQQHPPSLSRNQPIIYQKVSCNLLTRMRFERDEFANASLDFSDS